MVLNILLRLRDKISKILMFSEIYWLPRYYSLLKIAKFKKGGLILDAGCAQGLIAIALAKKGLRVIGIDKSIEEIAQARKLVFDKGLNSKIHFVVCDLCNLPFSGNHFDHVISLDTLEYIEDDLTALRECARVLKAQGKLRLALPLGYACSANLFSVQRILRRLIPHSFFSRDLPQGKAWLEADDDYMMRKLGDVRKYSLQEIKKKTEPLFRLLRSVYFLKIFSSLATDITYGIRGLSRFKFIFFFPAVRIDYYAQNKQPGYGLFLELVKKG
ncbi:MAG: class I SAM-dependent methyltransferase [Candidatus Omnitrophica bacterium]|nr:class I SAM-dependent methyltransferase [Candidatus Omnitrophota bacterium]